MSGHGGRSGLSLIEVVISAAIVSLLALVLMAANGPLSKTASAQGVVFEMDRAAGRFLSQLRREVRQSGFNRTTSAISVDGSTGALTFRQRRTFGDDLNVNWDPPVTYAQVGSALGNYKDGTARFKVTRSTGTSPSIVTMDVLDHVQSVTFTLIAGTDTLVVNLVLARTDPNWQGVGTPNIVRRYGEAIEFLNKSQQ